MLEHFSLFGNLQANNGQQSKYIQNAIAIEANSKHVIIFKSHYEKAIAKQSTSSANAANTFAN